MDAKFFSISRFQQFSSYRRNIEIRLVAIKSDLADTPFNFFANTPFTQTLKFDFYVYYVTRWSNFLDANF